MRDFMWRQLQLGDGAKDVALFMNMGGYDRPATRDDVPTTALVPAFVISELKKAFILGFVIFLPFLVIDIVTASVLMSMGMMMLPPILISLPFKVLLFVLVDGWHLLALNLGRSFIPQARRKAMSSLEVIALGREMILMALLVSAPLLGSGLLAGLVISIFQAVTQVNELTLTFVPKIITVALTLRFFFPGY